MSKRMTESQRKRAKRQQEIEEARRAKALGLVDANVDTGHLATMVKGANPVMLQAFQEAGAKVSVTT